MDKTREETIESLLLEHVDDATDVIYADDGIPRGYFGGAVRRIMALVFDAGEANGRALGAAAEREALAELCRTTPGKCFCGSHIDDLMSRGALPKANKEGP